MLFKNTYETIGVSKRCCPVYTKLLSLLPKHSQGQIQAVVDGSGNEGMPEEVGELVGRLEGLLKHTVNKVAKRERSGSSGSADSRTEPGRGVSGGGGPW